MVKVRLILDNISLREPNLATGANVCRKSMSGICENP